MENAIKIWTNYKSGAISERKAVNLLLEMLFKKKYEFGLAAFDDDSFSDFIVFMSNRFETVLRKYDPDISDFKTYLHSVINLTAFWWRKKIHERAEKNLCCQRMCTEENFDTLDFSTKEKDFYIEEPSTDNLIPIPDLAEDAMRNLDIRKEKNKVITKKRAQEIIKVLALKSCNNITDHQVEIAAEITGIPAEEFHRMVQQAEDTLKFKKDRISILQNKRNFAYFQRKKRIMKENCMKDHYPDIYLEKQVEKAEKRWEKAVEDLSAAAPLLVPSNKTVAKILNMSPRKVKVILDEAKQNFK
ncbi:hypothetical protein [Treponema sp.]|uniref:hypothetical protein n=1 Tax=Treponema sp. TaxID=166 RepID=UPI00388D664B